MRLRVLLLVVLSAFWGVHAFGQEDRGRISGVVADTTGAVIPKANVTVTNEATHVAQTVHSNDTGQYVVDLLIPDLYTVRVDAPGFKQFTATHVRLEIAGRVSVNAKLAVGQTSETVTVNEHGVVLKTSDAILGSTMEYRSIEDLPTQYGNAFELQLLQPGVISTTLSNGNHDYEGGSESTKVDGAQSGQTEFTIDGAPDTRNGGAVTTAFIPSHEFVGEFKVITGPYDASLSHTSGGSLDSSIKSGTSQYHGGGSWYWQPGTVNARGYSFSNSKVAPTEYNRETGFIGGPVWRRNQKLFFFAGFEKEHNSQGTQSVQTVPTDAEKNGDFSALFNYGSTITQFKQTVCTGVSQTWNPYEIFNAYSETVDPRCSGRNLRQPFKDSSGNVTDVIPASMIDPIAKKILSYYPEPTGSSAETPDGMNNYVWNGANVDHYWSVVDREDYNLSDRQKMFGHFYTSKRVQPGKNEFFPGASGQTLTLVNYGGVLDYVNTINSSTVLNARYSFTRFTTVTSLDAKTTVDDLGIPGNLLAGVPDIAKGFPEVKISGFGTLGNSDPGTEYDNIHDGQINLTRAQGRHTLKLGVEYRQYQANQGNYTGEHVVLGSSGTYTKGPDDNSTAAPIGQALASFELGVTESNTQTLNTSTSNNSDYYAAYVQDDWKVSPKLTVNLGLRYEYTSPVYERNDKSTTGFAFNTPNPIQAQAQANYAAHPSPLLPASQFKVLGGYLYANTPGDPKHGLWNAPKDLFSPRFGFAYNPVPKLVLRGGYGIFYSQLAEYVQYGNPLGWTQQTNGIITTNAGLSFINAPNTPLSNPFPNGLVQPSANSNGLLQNVLSSISTFYPQNPKSTYNERWSFGLEYQLPAELVLDMNYVGSNNLHIPITQDFNPLPNSYLSTDTIRTAAQIANFNKLSANVTNPFYGISVPGTPSLNGTTISQTQLLKPYPEFSAITYGKTTEGYGTYNALQMQVSKHFSHGYNLSVAYTRSKSLDAINFLNPGDPKPWYGLSNGDYPNLLAVYGIYELPFGRGKPFFSGVNPIVKNIISGFQLNGTYRIQSGQPITFAASDILAAGSNFSDIGKVQNKSLQHWFNTAAVDTNANDQLEDAVNFFPLRFNNVRQSNLDILNLGAERKFHIWENVEADFKCEAINALNHTVFSAPNTTPTSSAFGRVSGVGNQGRVVTFAFEGRF
ncbi:MAG TPA: TonB-dependent receptor [Bryocella sp.]|nr:TonB-dependent receptor [Bryocella sp.]